MSPSAQPTPRIAGRFAAGLMSLLLAITAQFPLLLVAAPVRAAGATINVPGDYATIGAAITAAAAGDTISVAAGSYSGALTISKSLTLLGAKSGVAAGPSPAPADRSAGTPFVGESVITSAVTVTADDVTVDGFVITTTSTALTVRGDGVVLANNILVGRTTSNNGITTSVTSGDNSYTISANRIVGGAKGIYLQGGVLTAASTVSDNYIAFSGGTPTGIETAASFAGGHTFSGNEIVGAATGILLGASGSTVSHNSISGFVGTTPTGIKATATNAALTITGNRVAGGRYGIWLLSPSVATTYTVTGNYLVDQSAATTTSGALWVTSVISAPKDGNNNSVTPSWATVDASGNYWGGAPAGRIGSSPMVSFTIVTSGPWIVGFEADPAKLGLPGFWPLITTTTCTTDCYVDAAAGSDGNDGTIDHPFATIHAGVAAVAASGTVHVGPGTYAGRIQVIRPMTIVGDPGDAAPGPGPSAPVIDNGLVAGDGFNLVHGVTGVTIAGFEIRNLLTTGAMNGNGVGVQAYVASTSDVTVADNWFHDVGYGVLVGNDGSGAKYALGTHTGWSVVRNVVERFADVAIELTNASDSTAGDNVIHLTPGTFAGGTSIDPLMAFFSYVRLNQSGLTIAGNTIDGALTRGYPAVYVYARDANLTGQVLEDLVVEHNLLEPTGTTAGIYLRDSLTGAIASARVTGNALTTPVALMNRTALVLDATGNWWGAPSGAATGQVDGTAATSPWISAFTPDPVKAGAPGFWPTESVHGLAETVPANQPEVEVTGDEDLGFPSLSLSTGDEPVVVTIAVGVGPVEEPGRTPFAAGVTIVEFTADGAEGPFTVCLAAAATDRLYHFTGGVWVEVTPTTFDDGVVEDGVGFLCGTVDSLSPFAAAEPLPVLTPIVTVADKVYDGTTAGTITGCTFAEDVSAVDVTCDYSGAIATFTSALAGTAIDVDVTGLALGGTDAGDYFIEGTAATTADISEATVTALVVVAARTYDGTTDATITSCTLVGVTSGDDVTCVSGAASADFDDEHVGTGKQVTVSGLTLGGDDAGNYTFAGTAVTSGDIGPRTLVVSATAGDKVYDGMTDASVALHDDRLAGDDLTITHTTAAFATPGAGTDKPVLVSGIAISGGANAGDYELDETTAATTADITRKALTVSPVGVFSITYGAAEPTWTPSITGYVTGEDETDLDTVPACDSAYTSSSMPGSYPVTCSGGVAGNYSFTYVPGTLVVGAWQLGPDDVRYTGQLLAYTKSATQTSAQVTLRASIDATFGTCSGATVASGTVTFRSGLDGKVIAKDVPIAQVGDDCRDGTAVAIATISAGPNYLEKYLIKVEVSGGIGGWNEAQWAGDKTSMTLVVSVPPSGLSTSSLAGSGDLGYLSSRAGTLTVGMDSAQDVRFDYVFTYGKKGVTPKGQAFISFNGFRGSVAGTYYVKTNAITSVSVDLATKSAVYLGKASISFVPATCADPTCIVAVDGGVSAKIEMTDAADDTVAITIQSTKTSTLYYSNSWVKSGKVSASAKQIPHGFGLELSLTNFIKVL